MDPRSTKSFHAGRILSTELPLALPLLHGVMTFALTIEGEIFFGPLWSIGWRRDASSDGSRSSCAPAHHPP
jgi:hypothetical protein